VAVTRKLLSQGRLNPHESIVITITGNGLKTVSAVSGRLKEEESIRPRLAEFEVRYLSPEPAAAV
jgi:threonine synthase